MMRRLGWRGGCLGLAMLVAACGFRPLYSAPGAGTQNATLAKIFVNVINDRPGQLLRQALQERLSGPDSGGPQTLTLSVQYGISQDQLGYQIDNSTTRVRDTARAKWSLHSVAVSDHEITGGTVRSIDGYNVINEQFFYEDIEEEAADRRLAEAVADEITQALAIYVRKHPDLG